MKLKISSTLYDEMEPAMEDAVKNLAAGTPDPADSAYLKLHHAKWSKYGISLEFSEQEVKELRDRAAYKIEVALENLRDDPPFWRGQLCAWRALVKQIDRRPLWRPKVGR